MSGKTENLVGQKFGRLVVLEFFGNVEEKPGTSRKTVRRVAHWTCLCECGKIINTRADRLKSGVTQSCGCFAREESSRRRKNATKETDERNAHAIFLKYRRKAELSNLEFSMSHEEVIAILRSPCFYCGIEPSNTRKTYKDDKSVDFLYNGIDRKNNNGSYTLENSVSCCEKCNLSKSDFIVDEFLKKVDVIYSRFQVKKEENATS